jgi:hypothetical protein
MPPTLPQDSELALVCAAVRAALNGDDGDRELESLIGPQTRWISFLTRALDHHVAGIVFASLSRMPGSILCPSVAVQLSQHAHRILEQRVDAIAETRRLAGALKAAGIPLIPIKGPLMRRRLFAGVAAGPSRDLDLLLPLDRQGNALRILAECGYAGEAGLTARTGRALMNLRGQDVLTRPGGRFAVEPHFSLAPSNFGVKIDHEGLWRRAAAAPDGEPFLVLEPEDEFLLLAFHGSKEQWTRLKWVADLAAFIRHYPQLDWDVIHRRAERQLLSRTVALAAFVLSDFGFPLIPSVPAMRDSDRLHILARQIRSCWANRPAPRSAFELSGFRYALCDTVAAKASYVTRTIVTPRGVHFHIVKLPDWMFPVYYPIKLIHDYVLWPLWSLAKCVNAALTRVKSALKTLT